MTFPANGIKPPGNLPFDPAEGCSHPPRTSKPQTEAQKALKPAIRWMRAEMVREFVRRLRRRENEVRGRMRKRKAALAISAAVMGLSTAAMPAKQDSYTNVQLLPDPTRERVDVSTLKVSDTMKEALAEEEGVRLTVYRDVAGYPTVGVGHLVTPQDGLGVGDRISYDQAIEFLERDLQTAEAAVQRLVGELPIFQHEFDALVDLVYNVGEGNVSQRESPRLNQAIANADYDGIAEQLHYYHAGGSKANGLVYRSERRQAIFMDAAYDDPRPAAVSVSGDVSA